MSFFYPLSSFLMVFSLLSYGEIKIVQAHTPREIDEKGRQFYESIGFTDFAYDRIDNFVDMSLLTGLKRQNEQE